MENEILQQILNGIKGIKSDVSELKQGQAELRHDVSELKNGQARLEQKATKIEVILENETNRNINLLVEGHKGIIKKLDGLPEKVRELQDSDKVQNVAIHELARRAANK